MDNFSTSHGTDVSSQIGALELADDLALFHDASLEAAGANVQIGMTVSPAACTPTLVCRIRQMDHDDGVLLRAADTTLAPATYPVPVTVCCGR